MAIELAVFDLLPGDMPAFARGFSAALIATSVCYPMDTLRWVATCIGSRVSFHVRVGYNETDWGEW